VVSVLGARGPDVARYPAEYADALADALESWALAAKRAARVGARGGVLETVTRMEITVIGLRGSKDGAAVWSAIEAARAAHRQLVVACGAHGVVVEGRAVVVPKRGGWVRKIGRIFA
jgi:hypothetical protein